MVSIIQDDSIPRMIYIRPTIDNRIAVWVGLFGDTDPRPTPEASYFMSVVKAELALPAIMEETGDYFGVCYLYLDKE